jgi:tetratricopeptide (TPR) repeat protein
MKARSTLANAAAATMALTMTLPVWASGAADCFRNPDAACLFRTALEGARAATLPEYRATMLAEVAALHAQAGDIESAREVFAMALSESRGIRQPRERASIWCFLAERQEQFGNLAGARTAIRDALALIEQELSAGYDETSYTLTHTFRRCVALQADVDGAEEAAETLVRFIGRVNTIADVGDRHTELVSTAGTQAAIGDTEGAKATLLAARRLALSLPPGVQRANQLSVVAGEQLRIVGGDAARSTLKDAADAIPTVDDPEERRRLETLISVLMLKLLQP